MKLSKELLVNKVKEDIVDNSVGAVSPLDIRQNLFNIIDSVSNLTERDNLHSLNFSTHYPRTVIAGVDTLAKRDAVGFASTDNVAIGFASLKSQIDSKQNTAIGSYSMTCNMYGYDNVAVGFHAQGSLINGYGNIGLGSYSLNGNKEGNFNISIGHGSAYYVDRKQDYQFYLASHPVDTDYICSNSNGDGLKPLLRGDLSASNLRLGIGVRDLHDGAALQVEGNIHPATTESYNLGSSSYRFQSVYLKNRIDFPSNHSITFNDDNDTFTVSSSTRIKGSTVSDSDISTLGKVIATGAIESSSSISGSRLDVSGGVTFNGDIVPNSRLASKLGDSRKEFLEAHIYNIYSGGIARFNQFHAVQQSHFKHKTIYLGSSEEMDTIDGGGASSLHVNFDPNQTQQEGTSHLQYLLDEELNNAGFKIGASGLDYLRTYEWTFRSNKSILSTLAKDNIFTRSSWFSNISVQLDDGCHVEADRLINSDKVGMFTYDDGLGFFIDNGVSYLTPEEQLDTSLAGLGYVNFIADSGVSQSEYDISFQTPQSGLNIFHTFYTNTANYSLDNDGKEKLDGFKSGYISNSKLEAPNFFNEQENQRPNRYIISSYNDSSYAKRCFTLLQDNTEGYVGISNFDYSESMLPDTIFNIRSTGNAIARITAENNGTTQAAVQLLGEENCLNYGTTLEYSKSDGLFSINTYNNENKKSALTINDQSGNVSILDESMTANTMLSVGSPTNTEASIAIHASTGVPTHTADYGQIFIRPFEGSDTQEHILSFMDGSGNLFNVDLTTSSADGSLIDKPLALDNNGNTFGGITPSSRIALQSCNRNTAYGYHALNIVNGANDNVAIGWEAGASISTGTHNVHVGSQTGSNNTSYSISLGTSLSCSDRSIQIGHGTKPIIKGMMYNTDLSSDNQDVYLGVYGDLDVYGQGTTNPLQIKSNTVEFVNSLTIKDVSDSYITCYNGNSFTGTEQYNNSTNSYTAIGTDLRVRGSIRFANNTSIDNANFLDDIATLQSDVVTNANSIVNSNSSVTTIQNNFDSLIVEGVVESDIRFDELPNSFDDTPKRFYIRRKVVNSSSDKYEDAATDDIPPRLVEVTLRDPYLDVRKNDFVIAIRVVKDNGQVEYRPISITGSG